MGLVTIFFVSCHPPDEMKLKKSLKDFNFLGEIGALRERRRYRQEGKQVCRLRTSDNNTDLEGQTEPDGRIKTDQVKSRRSSRNRHKSRRENKKDGAEDKFLAKEENEAGDTATQVACGRAGTQIKVGLL